MTGFKETTIMKAALVALAIIPLLIYYFRFSSVASAQVGAPDIIIDAGHGGIDGGAVGVGGSIEKELNLQISLKLRDILQQRGYDVLMLRSTDESLHPPDAVTVKQKKTGDLKKRLATADTYPDSLFISIHQNSYAGGSGVHGATLYCGRLNDESKVLADCIFTQIKTLQPENHREIKTADNKLFLLSNVKNTAVMVECGFISNQQEEKRLCDGEYQQQFAAAIADGICEFLNNRVFE